MGLLWEEYIVRLKEKERHAFTGLALFIVCINLLPSLSALIVLCKDSDYSLNTKIRRKQNDQNDQNDVYFIKKKKKAVQRTGTSRAWPMVR